MKYLWLLLTLTGSLARAQFSAENIRLVSADTLLPGKNLAVNILIRNLPEKLSVKTALPENWKVLSENSYPLGEKGVRLFYFISPEKRALSGTYKIGFELSSEQGSVSLSTPVFLESTRELELTRLKNPEFVLEKDTLRTSYLIENRGNTVERVALHSKSSKIVGPDTLNIMPKSAVEVNLVTYIPKTSQSIWEANTDLTILPGEGKPLSAYTNTNVYSRGLKKADRFLRLPVYAGLGLLHYDANGIPVTSYQFMMNGAGYLDANKKHEINFNLRGPNQILFPAIGTYDNYSVNYKNSKHGLELSLGDYSNQVSNLLEFSRYGRGARVTTTYERTEFSVFYQNARFFRDQRNSVGGQAKFTLQNGLKIGVNLMNKQAFRKGNWFNPTLFSAVGLYDTDKLKLEAELANSVSGYGSSLGFHSQATGNFGKLSAYSTIILTGKNFYGFYNNSRQFTHGVNYNANSKLSLGLNSNLSQVNPGLDLTFFTISPYYESVMAFMTYRPLKNHTLFMNFTRQEREDRQPVSQFHYKESFVNTNYSYESHKVRVESQFRMGKAQNLQLTSEENKAKPGYELIITPSFQPVKGVWVGGYFQHQHTNKFSQNNSLENLYYYGFRLQGNFSKNFNFNLSYRNNFSPDEFYQKRSFLDAGLMYQLKETLFDFRASQNYLPGINSVNQNTLFFSFNIIQKLNLPIGKNKNIGHLSGQLKGSSGINLANQQVRMGQFVSVTDEYGRFFFSNLEPGTYHVGLDESTREAGVTTRDKLMKEVSLVADSVSNIEIQLVRTGGITGKVDFEITDKFVELRQKGEFAQTLVKLLGKESYYVTYSDKNGLFSFKDIKPGEYSITVSLLKDKESMVVQNPERSVIVQSGALTSEEFMVRSIERKVKFTDQEFKLTKNK